MPVTCRLMSVFVLFAVRVLAADTHPDFTGVWRIQHTSEVYEIEQRGDHLRITMIVNDALGFRVVPTEAEIASEEASAAFGPGGILKAFWTGKTLVWETFREISGQKLRNRRVMTLSKDGATLIANRIRFLPAPADQWLETWQKQVVESSSPAVTGAVWSGQEVRGTLDDTHYATYRVTLSAGDFFSATVRSSPFSPDIVITDAANKPVHLVAGGDYQSGITYIAYIAETSGTHTIRIYSLTHTRAPRPYVTVFNAIRLASAADGTICTAEQARTTGRKISRLGSNIEGYREAAALLESAVSFFESANDAESAAESRLHLARAFGELGKADVSKALYTRTLAEMEKLRDVNGQAAVYESMGRLAYSLRQNYMAVRHFKKTLPLYQTAANRYGETEILWMLGLAHNRQEQYSDAISVWTRRAELLSKFEDSRELASVQSATIKPYLNWGKKEEALTALNNALANYQSAGDISSQVHLLHGVAETLLTNGIADENALRLSLSALAKAQESRLQLLEANIRISVAYLLVYLKRYAGAPEHLRQAMLLHSQLGNTDGELNVLRIQGYYAEFAANDKTLAIRLYSQSADRAREAGRRERQRTALFDRARVYLKLGQRDRALAQWIDEVESAKQTNDAAWANIARLELEELVFGLENKSSDNADFSAAQSLLQASIADAQRRGEPAFERKLWQRLHGYYLREEANFSTLLDSEIARARATNNLQWEADILVVKAGLTLTSPGAIARLYSRASELYLQTGEHSRAFTTGDTACRFGAAATRQSCITRVLSISPTLLDVSALIQRANLQFNFSRTQAQLTAYRAIERRIDEMSSAADQLEPSLLLAYLYIRLSSLDDALRVLQKLEADGFEDGEVAFLHATVLEKRQQIDQAWKVLHPAVNRFLATGLVKKPGFQRQWDNSQAFVTDDYGLMSLSVRLLVRLALRDHNETFAKHALEIADVMQARGLSTRFLLSQNTADVSASGRVQLERELGNKVAALQQQILTKSNSALSQQLRSELQSVSELRESIRRSLLNRTSPKPVVPQSLIGKLHKIQERLPQDGVLLEYALLPTTSYVWAVTRSSCEVFNLPSSVDIARLAQAWYAGGSTPPRNLPNRTNDRDNDSAIHVATRISAMLLGSVERYLSAKTVIIVAGEELSYISFAALPVPARTDRQQMADEHSIVYLPSTSAVLTFPQFAAEQRNHLSRVAVFADPVMSDRDTRVPKSPEKGLIAGTTSDAGIVYRAAAKVGLSRSDRGGLPRLVFTAAEARQIRIAYPTQADEFVGFDATRRNAIESFTKYDVLHFATHAVANYEHPELSGIIFSLFSREGLPQDGFLSLGDIYNLHTDAGLVVLSACSTAISGVAKGDGIVGLTHAFIYAGARRVIATLWRIDDEATSSFMTAFYRVLATQKFTPAEALKEAQGEMKRSVRWNAPYYWAGFMLMGDWH